MSNISHPNLHQITVKITLDISDYHDDKYRDDAAHEAIEAWLEAPSGPNVHHTVIVDGYVDRDGVPQDTSR